MTAGSLRLAGIIAINNLDSTGNNNSIIGLLAHSMRLLQHRGKAYWKMIIGDKASASEGSLPTDDTIMRIANKEKLHGNSAIGYLSKRSPQFHSFDIIRVALDGFLVDTEKLYLHPEIGTARDSDSLYKICHIFTKLLIDKNHPERAIQFLDRHLRGNLITKIDSQIFAYRNSTGFKPLVFATNKDRALNIIASENSLRTSFVEMDFLDVMPGQLVRLNHDVGLDVVTKLPNGTTMIDPFEFIRESHVASTLLGKSLYTIRKDIGKEQANFLGKDLNIESAFAEPDYARPMGLGFNIEFQKQYKNCELSEGIIKDRYDDSDHMIDFSEQVSKNKLLTTGKSLKFVIGGLVRDKNVATIQGTIQTGGTAKETIHYLRRAGAKRIEVIVSYVVTIDGRQVGLYTQNRDLTANKFVGDVTTIQHLNKKIAKEIGADAVYYNSPEILARGIGLSAHELWFPEWVRFLDYQSQ
jgi:amidophosphoribosyltransferase